MTQQLFLASLGIITERNKIASTQPGSLTQNSYPLVCRSPGVMEGASNNTTALTVAGLNRTYVFSIDKYVLVVSNRSSDNVWVYRWFDTSVPGVAFGPISLVNTTGVADTMSFQGRFGAITVRDRTLLTGSNQIYVFDTIAPATTAQATCRTAGMQTPFIANVNAVDAGTGSALNNNTNLSLTVVFRRVMSDGYEIFSAPSVSIWYGTTTLGSSVANLLITFDFDGTNLLAGDVAEIYRTKSQAYTGSAGTNTGADYFLSASYVITSTDITNDFAAITDKTPDSSLGEALYTNTGVSGGNATALTPPQSRCISYYRGHTFYSNYTQGASWDVRVGAYWGFMGTSASGLAAGGRKSGIGSRSVVGNTTISNPTMTAVSAGDIVGIVIGQQYGTSTFPFPSYVTAVGATSITFNQNAIGSTTGGTHEIVDVIEITYAGSASLYRADDMKTFSSSIGNFAASNGKISMTGLGIILSPPVGSYAIGPLPADSLTFFLRYLDGQTGRSFFSVRATNGANYVPQLPRIELAESPRLFTSKATKNGVAWSEKDQPEYFCGTNADNVGGGEILAVAATRDALWYFCTDGIYRWSGTGGSVADGYDWRLDPIDKTFVISGPQSWCVLRDNVYAYGNRGFIMIDSAGNITELSPGRCDDVMPGRTWIELAYPGNASLQMLDGPNGYYLVADDKNNEVVLKKKDLDQTGFTWIYNAHQDCITRDYPDLLGGTSPDHGVWNESKAQIYHAISDPSGSLFMNTNTPGSTRAIRYEFQPVVTDDPFTMRQFQRVEVVFDLDVPTNVTLVCRFNDNAATDQTRTFAAATGPSVNNRLSFIVPRNAPAVANTIKIRLIATTSGGGAFVRLLGVALKYSNPTEQRKAR